MFKGMSLRKFNTFFQCENDCSRYLYRLKWRKGYQCRRCSNRSYWTGKTRFHARCRSCGYDESATANTVFHRIHISLHKAFIITFHCSTYKKGLSSRNLAKLVEVDQKTILAFSKKVQKAMSHCVSSISIKSPKTFYTYIDGVVLTGRSDELNGLQRVAIKVEMGKSRSANKSAIRCTYIPESEMEYNSCGLIEGRYEDKNKGVLFWNIRSWFTGIHHHCSASNFNSYLSEFNFRYNLRNDRNIWHCLISWMMRTEA